jgi:hypothetical protein
MDDFTEEIEDEIGDIPKVIKKTTLKQCISDIEALD